jgi:beta-galactosidase
VGDRPLLLCEYAHSMGNSTGNLREYWELIRARRECMAGGFIWDWADQGLVGSGVEGEPERRWLFGGDFGDQPNDAQFCINGLCWPDRAPHPALHEVAAFYAPVRLLEVSREAPGAPLVLVVHNERHFVDTGDLEFAAFAVGSDGEPLVAQPAPLPLDPVAPQGTARVPLPPACGAVDPGAALLEVTVSLREDTAWAPRGHVLVRRQLQLPDHAQLAVSPPAPEPADRVTVTEASTTFSLAAGPQFEVTISKVTGLICGLRAGGEDLLAAPLEVCLFRAPTDNDRGGSEGTSYAARWLRAGLDRLELAGPAEVELLPGPVVSTAFVLRAAAAAVGQGTEEVAVQEVGGAHFMEKEEQEGREKEGPRQDEGRDADAWRRHRASVRVRSKVSLAGGGVRCTLEIDTSDALPHEASLPAPLRNSLPRCGVRFSVPARLADLAEFLGKGPFENYPDRKWAALHRRFSLPLADFHTPYIVPGENGARCDVSWLELHAQKEAVGSLGGACALRVESIGGGPFCAVSLSPYALEELARRRHDHELEASGRVHVHFDAAHMGVGGDNSW